jgi:hypothetical protein
MICFMIAKNGAGANKLNINFIQILILETTDFYLVNADFLDMYNSSPKTTPHYYADALFHFLSDYQKPNEKIQARTWMPLK